MSPMKEEGPPVLPSAGSTSESLGTEQLLEAKPANVPVVVLGANIGGLAAAVAIRSRTGRAVCVLDVNGGDEAVREGTEDVPFLLSARCLDAVRAINADLQRAVLTSLYEDSPPVAYSTASSVESAARLSSSHLRDIFVSYLTTGQGGASFIWRSCSVSRIFEDTRETPYREEEDDGEDDDRDEEGHRSIVIVFDDGVAIRTGLLVVATAAIPVQALISERAQPDGEGLLSESMASGDESFISKGGKQPSEFEAALLNEAERKALSFASSVTPSTLTVCSDSPREELAATDGKFNKGAEEWAAAQSTATTSSLPTILTGLHRVRSFARRCSIPKGADSPWSFNEGRIVLTGAAAHPWASSLCDGIELDLEDAAQLGCSLFDWKFQVRMASERFQAIRKRRLAAVLTSPKIAMSLSGESPDAIGDASTTASPAAFFEEEQTFVPTRDAYAELLPSVGLAYEVQEAEVD